MRVISLGAGVQSTAMALMAANGDLPPVDHAIFADTQWEPPHVYEHLKWLKGVLPYPVHVITAGDLRSRTERGLSYNERRPFFDIPIFVHAEKGGWVLTRRQCTSRYKVRPIARKIRDICGLPEMGRVPDRIRVEQWLGISTDEIHRARTAMPGQPKWLSIRYPLIDEGLSRQDCLAYFQARHPGRELRKSACIGCPFHSKADWHRMYYHDRQSYNDAAAVENAANQTDEAKRMGGVRLSQWGKLDEIEWNEEPEQGEFWDECGGYCHT